jgi:ribonuclease D
LTAAEQAAARALAQWRERRALESNKPRGWILADEAIYTLATRAPASVEALEGIESVPPGVARKRGEELVALITEARAHPVQDVTEPPRKPTAAEQARASALMQAVRDCATALGIGPEVLATRRDVEAIAFGSTPLEQSPLLRGWRGSVLGAALREIGESK